MVETKLGTPNVSYLLDFDHVFFFGDVNSRLVESSSGGSEQHHPVDVDASLSEAEKKARSKKTDHAPQEREVVLNLVRKEMYHELLARDQLRLAQAQNLCLYGFVEAESFPFPPTFKVGREPGYAYNSKRLPSYCDRILFYSLPTLVERKTLKQLDLWSDGFGVTTSDHKPVSSVFHVTLMRKSQLVKRDTSSNKPKSLRALGLRLVFSNLECKNLLAQDLNGLADPYLVLYSKDIFPLEKGSSPNNPVARTKVVFRSLNPAWKGQVIETPLPTVNPEDLKGMSVALSIWDFDSLSHDDPMGEVVFNLDDIIEVYLYIYNGRFGAQNQRRKIITQKLTAYFVCVQAYEKNMRFTLSDVHILKEAGAEVRGQCFFTYPVIFHGRQAGTMSGKVRLAPGARGLGLSGRNVFSGAMCCWKITAHAENLCS